MVRRSGCGSERLGVLHFVGCSLGCSVVVQGPACRKFLNIVQHLGMVGVGVGLELRRSSVRGVAGGCCAAAAAARGRRRAARPRRAHAARRGHLQGFQHGRFQHGLQLRPVRAMVASVSEAAFYSVEMERRGRTNGIISRFWRVRMEAEVPLLEYFAAIGYVLCAVDTTRSCMVRFLKISGQEMHRSRRSPLRHRRGLWKDPFEVCMWCLTISPS